MKITAFETIELPASQLPQLLFVRVHTDEGITGLGDTFYLPQACREVILRDMAPALLGTDPRDIEGHAARLLGSYYRFGGRGAEIRAWSAVEVALWDILGKAAGLPVYRLIGGAAQPGIKAYNSCGGTSYGKLPSGARPGHGLVDDGELADYQSVLTRPAELAKELLDEGLTGMKFWSFDAAARASGPHHISNTDLKAAIEPVERIRGAVGDAMDIMIDFHGLWSLPAATKIARALEPYGLTWAEDLMLVEAPGALRRLRESTTVPILASEYTTTSFGYKALLDAEAMDVAMIDPTWTGGISESMRTIALADAAGIPVAFHDCSGPVNLLAGIHLGVSSAGAMYQETLRSWTRILYPELVTRVPEITDGIAYPPEEPGIGTELRPDLTERFDAVVSWAR